MVLTGIDNVHVNALTTGRFVLIESEGSEAELLARWYHHEKGCLFSQLRVEV